MKKRVLSLIMLIVVMATTLSGCGEKEKEEKAKVTKLSVGLMHTVQLMSDGTVKVDVKGDNNKGKDYGKEEVEKWKDIVDIATDEYCTFGVKSDGTVIVAGQTEINEETDFLLYEPFVKEKYNVSKWKDIKAISVGPHHTVGLKNDGTVVAVGMNDNYECDVSLWNNITEIVTGENFSAGLKSDGTVIATFGLFISDEEFRDSLYNGEKLDYNIKNFKDIVQIDAGNSHLVGLKKDGTVVTFGSNDNFQCEVDEWTDIVSVSASGESTFGIKKDGTVDVTIFETSNGFVEDFDDWKDIVYIDAGQFYVEGITSKGKVVSTIKNK